MTNLNHSDKESYNRDCYNPVKENFMAFSYSEEHKSHTPHNFEKWLRMPAASRVTESLDLKPSIDIEKQFNELVARWKDETGVFSTTYDKVINDTFLEIISLGKNILPLILKDLKYEGGHWHTALKVFAGENPVPNEYLRNSKKVREIWLTWGMSKKLI